MGSEKLSEKLIIALEKFTDNVSCFPCLDVPLHSSPSFDIPLLIILRAYLEPYINLTFSLRFGGFLNLLAKYTAKNVNISNLEAF